MKKVSRNSVDISDCRVSGLFEIVLCCLLKRRQPSDLRFDNLGKFVHEKQKAHVIAQDDRLTAGAGLPVATEFSKATSAKRT